jgi:ABC-type transport system involved in cytochrome c biogenesis permease component
MLVGTYVAAVLLVAFPAALLLLDRDVPALIAMPLALLLGTTAIVVVTVPVRVYLGLRHRDR